MCVQIRTATELSSFREVGGWEATGGSGDWGSSKNLGPSKAGNYVLALVGEWGPMWRVCQSSKRSSTPGI